MSNPLDRRPAATGPIIPMREWCDTQNRTRILARIGRWHYVTKQDGEDIIATLQGAEADNVRLLIEGRLDDFAGWPKARMDGYRNWLARCARAGMLTAPRLEAA